MVWIYAIISVVLVSLLSILAAVPLLIKKKVSDKVLLVLLSGSVGVLLATVFLNFLPEIIEHTYTPGAALVIMLGFFVMFVLEKFVHWHHSKKHDEECGHGHAFNLAPINLIGDGIHNFIDGLVIAGAYAANITVGITATVSIILHEIPQEIADFGVLLFSGLSKPRALLFNFISAATAILGTIVGLILVGKAHGFTTMILPFAAGNFIYIAASNLLPQLHRHCKWKDTTMHIAAMIIGVVIVVILTLFGPAHGH